MKAWLPRIEYDHNELYFDIWQPTFYFLINEFTTRRALINRPVLLASLILTFGVKFQLVSYFITVH